MDEMKIDGPFPNPEIPDLDSVARLVPPWIKFPNLRRTSMGWRMGMGDHYKIKFEQWWKSLAIDEREAFLLDYPAPAEWHGYLWRTRGTLATLRARVMGMSPPVQISYDCFDELIAQLRAAGHTSAAERLDVLLHRVAWTTGSELLGELGAEILQFQRSTHSISAAVRHSLGRSLEMVRRVWPEIDKYV